MKWLPKPFVEKIKQYNMFIVIFSASLINKIFYEGFDYYDLPVLIFFSYAIHIYSELEGRRIRCLPFTPDKPLSPEVVQAVRTLTCRECGKKYPSKSWFEDRMMKVYAECIRCREKQGPSHPSAASPAPPDLPSLPPSTFPE